MTKSECPMTKECRNPNAEITDGNCQPAPSSFRHLSFFRHWVLGHSSFFRHVVIAVAVAIVWIQWIRIAIVPRGDFPSHWEFGRRLAEGEFLYKGGYFHPYLPFWALVHAPLTLMPMHAAQVLVYPLFIGSMVTLIWILHRLTRDHLPLEGKALFWVTALTLGLSSRFIIRDMMECGVNLALVALSWVGVFLWVQRRELLGGVSLGLAMALKCTPALFLAYFVWKRQWKMAALTTAAAAVFSLSPLLWMGPAEYTRAVDFWLTNAWKCVGETDPSRGVLGPEALQNISLRPSLARFLMHLPEGHIGRLEDPLYVDFFNLPPRTAGLVVKVLLLALLGAVAWNFRHSVRRRDELTIIWECAAISLMILLYSPITWGQHCVGVIPVFYLITRTSSARGGIGRWMKIVLAVYVVCILGLNRAFVGRQMSWLLDSYHVHTWCIGSLLAVAIGCRSRSMSAERLAKRSTQGCRSLQGQTHVCTASNASAREL